MISLIPLPVASQARSRRFVQCAQVAVSLSSPWLISCHGPVGEGNGTKHSFAVNADEHLAATVERGLRLSGTTVASHSFVVMAPQLEGAQLSTMLITEIVPAGTAVKAGEVLVRFDPQAQMKDYLEKRDKFAELEGQVA